MDAEHFNELKDSIRQMKAIKAAGSALLLSMKLLKFVPFGSCHYPCGRCSSIPISMAHDGHTRG
jgi:hypothetical protein